MSQTEHLSGKVRKSSLPIIEPGSGQSGPRLKRLLLPQGELAQFHDGGRPMEYLAYIELRAGSTRGNHYHKAKEEFVYVLQGELLLLLEDLANGARDSVRLQPGDLVIIQPGVAHALKILQSGHAIEFSPLPFDPSDTYRHPIAES